MHRNDIKKDWFEFGTYGLVPADELDQHRDELKRLGKKCTAVYFDMSFNDIIASYNKQIG